MDQKINTTPNFASRDNSVEIKHPRLYWVLFVVWTLAVGSVLVFANFYIRNTYQTLLYGQVEAASTRDLLFRAWNARFGGVYVPVKDGFEPNPYLHHPKRDVVTTNGDHLTLINPAWMTRMVSEMQHSNKDTDVPVSKLTSSRLMNPKNAPDEWEEKALEILENGDEDEIHEILFPSDGKPQIRIARPLKVNESCLTCHAEQGYKVGDIRGIISTRMAAAPLLSTRNGILRFANITGVIIWLVGIAGLLIFRYRFTKYATMNREMLAELREKEHALSVHRDHLEEEIAVRTRELLEATERNRLMQEGVPLTCGLFNERLEMFDCNQRTVDFFGLGTKEATCGRILELFPQFQPNGEPSMELAQKELLGAFESGYRQLEWFFQLESGEQVPAEVTLVRLMYDNQPILAAYTRDLRKEKVIEAEKAKRDKMMSSLNNAARLLLSFDSSQSFNTVAWEVFDLLGKAAEVDRVYIWKNHRDATSRLCCTQLYEWSPDADPQQGNDLTVDIAYEEAIPTWEKTLESGECVNNLVRLMTPEEQAQLTPQGIVSILVAPIMFKGEFWGFIGFDDCKKERKWTGTEIGVLRSAGGFIAGAIARQQLETSLLHARDEAEQSSRAKSEFLATMSHEIRTPLNGVIGLSDLLLGTELNRKQHEYAQLIKVSGESLLFLINDILDFSKIEAGKFEIADEDFDLLNTVESAMGILASRAKAKDLELCAAFSEGMPRILEGDAGRVRQVLLNLIGNAIKFTEEGGVQILVTPEGWKNDRLIVKISIADTGIGIPADKMDRLFKTFSQTDASSARIYGGTGLGLAISMRLAQLMDGEIGVESEPGVGST
ncbi:MAG: ATP-binding protein, partial [Thermoguttaceae bacterium]